MIVKRVTKQDVVNALKELGGEAQSFEIKDQVTNNFGGVPSNYKNRDSFRETIQGIIQNYCPEEDKYVGYGAVFRKVRRGRFRLIESDRQDNTVKKEIAKLIVVEENKHDSTESFNPTNIQDSRERAVASIVRRRGQPKFRQKLLEIYEGKCAITGEDAEQALEASHIIPYKGEETNHSSNGLLLRADLHILFDLRLLAIDTTNLTVILSPELMGTSYLRYAGVKLNLPSNANERPNIEALNIHRRECGL